MGYHLTKTMLPYFRNNNISSLQMVRHPKKQPVGNIRRRHEAVKMQEPTSEITPLSIDERHRQRREGAGEFLDSSMWKK